MRVTYKHLSFRPGDDLRREIFAHCERSGESISELCRRAVAAIISPSNPKLGDLGVNRGQFVSRFVHRLPEAVDKERKSIALATEARATAYRNAMDDESRAERAEVVGRFSERTGRQLIGKK